MLLERVGSTVIVAGGLQFVVAQVESAQCQKGLNARSGFPFKRSESCIAAVDSLYLRALPDWLSACERILANQEYRFVCFSQSALATQIVL